MTIRRALAIEFARVAQGGRNDPLMIRVETDDGAQHDVYLKPSGRPEIAVTGMVCELLGAMLAGDLGIAVNEPFLVEIDEAFIRSIPDEGIRALLRRSSPLAFGSKSAGPQWRDWSAGDIVTDALKQSALQIFAFDVMIENFDRTVQRPNLLIKGNEIRVIDHETAFKFGLIIGEKAEPWRQGYCHKHLHRGCHVLGQGLKGKVLDFAPLSAVWSALSPISFMRYAGGVPSEWAEGMKTVRDAERHLTQVHEQFDGCLVELKRALT